MAPVLLTLSCESEAWRRTVVKVPVYGRGGVVRAHALVDDVDGEVVMAHRWHMDCHGYVVRTVGAGAGRQRFKLHRVIAGLVPGDGLEADHKNGDPLDCRRENLRVCTHAQNLQNRRGGYGTSSYRGVARLRGSGRWVAYAKIAGHRHHLGYFDREDDAAAAAAEFRREHMPFSSEAAA